MSHFWNFLFFREILQLGKFEGADLKYNYVLFKFQPKKYPNKSFLVRNLGIFAFSRNFAIRQIRGCSNIAILFSNSSPKLPKSGIFGPKFRNFHYFTKFCNYTNPKVLISNMTILLSNSSTKILK